MGFISEFIAATKDAAAPLSPEASRSRWRDTFGLSTATDKERGSVIPSSTSRPTLYNPRNKANEAAYVRLLAAMQSRAPGTWSDNRWVQTDSFEGAQYLCIHRIGEQLAQSEIKLYKRDPKHPDGKRLVTPHDPPEGGRLVRPYDLVRLLERPNPQEGWGDLVYKYNQQNSLTGTWLTWMVPNRLGIPFQLYSIPTAIAVPQAVASPEFPDGFYRIQPVYPYGPFSSSPTPYSAVGAAIPAQWMMRTKYPHPLLHYDGYSPLTGLRLHIDEMEMMDRSRHATMRGAINPSAVLNMSEMEGNAPLPHEEIERIRAEFEDAIQGPENQGQLFVATPGAELEPWGRSAVDMDYVNGWEQLLGFIMAALGISKPAAMMVETSSYSTLFATLKQLHLLTLKPICNRVATAITIQLAPFFGDDLIVEVTTPRIDDHELTKAQLDTAITAKCITKNEVRKRLEELKLPPTKEEWGDEIAGYEAPPEGAAGGMPGMPGAEGQPLQGGPGSVPPPPQPPELERARPQPDSLGAGSLGPKKRLPPLEHRMKSFYQQVQEACRNGSH